MKIQSRFKTSWLVALVSLSVLALSACSGVVAASNIEPTYNPPPGIQEFPIATQPRPAPQEALPTTPASEVLGAINSITSSTIEMVANPSLGSILVDSKGMTLYLFTNDKNGVTTCSGNCLVNWPLLFTNGAPIAGAGVDGSKLGTKSLPDGTTYVTYNNQPLYYFIKDTTPGDTLGQGVGSVWFVVAP
jgi:predicted lipoprotein with Yx(FWY)xxD motif